MEQFPSNHNVIYVDEDVVKVNHPEVIGGNTLNLYADLGHSEIYC